MLEKYLNYKFIKYKIFWEMLGINQAEKMNKIILKNETVILFIYFTVIIHHNMLSYRENPRF